jgi:PLP dependent protein
MFIRENIDFVTKQISSACEPQEACNVNLLAATKKQTPKAIEEAIDAGIKICGENYLQEAKEKIPLVKREVDWHFIGHLQSNKAKKAVELFDCIQSVDTIKLAGKINDCSENKFPIFLSVNIGEEENKFGIKPNDVEEVFLEVNKMDNLDIKGLFCMAPFTSDTTKYFNVMRDLSNKLKLNELSMGMSNDYLNAINYGSTMVRLGTSIFGKRE